MSNKLDRWIHHNLGDDWGGSPSPPGPRAKLDFGEIDNGRSMFGRQHLQETLADLGEIPLPTAVRHLQDAVRQFESGHPPSDDLTLLLMRWNGPSSEY